MGSAEKLSPCLCSLAPCSLSWRLDGNGACLLLVRGLWKAERGQGEAHGKAMKRLQVDPDLLWLSPWGQRRQEASSFLHCQPTSLAGEERKFRPMTLRKTHLAGISSVSTGVRKTCKSGLSQGTPNIHRAPESRKSRAYSRLRSKQAGSSTAWEPRPRLLCLLLLSNPGPESIHSH